MTGSIEQGTSETRGSAHLLHFLVRLPRPVEKVWPALATEVGLAAWYTPADVLEHRLEGAVTLRGVGAGRVTAWDVERVAEYTVEGGGRIRFHLERDGDQGTTLRFTHEFRGEQETEQRWRARFERLIGLLEGGT
ncbi:SRPBCC family protein [Streptomyces sp. TRM S81-3]|uniref:SRPBCC family protein n=1 Tax=Streptomyces griseicoloratus TaxID=2752516 RepID=A0A926LC65_9ACTN|nr:SRPBCC family protein [Streptomyces griseicoloratus]MBD0423873.1 SRPBCC family protein [Streptomyces griseicoloratus]